MKISDTVTLQSDDGSDRADPESFTDPRKGRAWNLMSTIASERGFPEGTPLKQVDDTWGAREDTNE